MAHQLFDVWPSLATRLPVARLARVPTPVGPFDALLTAIGPGVADLYLKRDDLTSPLYGGNKVRTLEVLFGRANAEGRTHVFSTGAFGSNHAVATVLHAPRAGLSGGALLFPQPPSPEALQNLEITLAKSHRFVALPHWSTLPFGMAWLNRSERRLGHRPFIMVPGGATPEGALAYVGAAFELARQIEANELPRPDRVIIGVGSTCTSAGLLAGFAIAARMGIGFVDGAGRPAPPMLVSVRVTPWPVTSRTRIVGLAMRTLLLLTRLAEDPSIGGVERRALESRLTVEGEFLGRGYGYATREGREAIRLFEEARGPELDTTYSAKAGAAVVHWLRRGGKGATLYWATKSTARLPDLGAEGQGTVPRRVRRWLDQAALSRKSAG